MPEEVALELDGCLRQSDHIAEDEYRFIPESLCRWHDREYKHANRPRERFED